MATAKKDVSALCSVDVYSLVLFTLYQIQDIPEYATLSELAYILDKPNLLYLLEYFGGTTIRIPTKEELQTLISTLLVYQYVNIEHMTYTKAISMLNGISRTQYKEIKELYDKVCKVLDRYYIDGTK